jgi:putative Mg2+ transporter-C (MgtC) family protein
LNRGEHGHPAGLRTTLLVCLAASISMIQVNLLLGMSGKSQSSFAVMDLMRLPLGILSGMGFIGAGAILRHDDRVFGITTAATLWFVTVMGLCFGGGQLVLGGLALLIAWLVLSVLKNFESSVQQDRRAILTVAVDESGPSEKEVMEACAASGLRIASSRLAYKPALHQREFEYSIHWRSPANAATPPETLESLAKRPGILSIEWNDRSNTS